MNTVPSVFVIIVNWNGRADTLECLRSLGTGCYRNKNIIVVDNGSVDGSVAVIRRDFPAVTLIETGRNLGFTGGNNAGIAVALQSGADYIYLLNNDTVSEPDAIEVLIAAAEGNPQFGLLTPRINYFDRKSEPWFAGSILDLTRGLAVHDNNSVPARSDRIRELEWASGCAMLIRRGVLEQIAGFDDKFFLSWEDVDLSLRLRKTGMKIGLVPAAKIYHKVGRSFVSTWGVGTYYSVRNQLLLMSIHGKQSTFLPYLKVYSLHIRRAAWAIFHREPHCLRGFVFVLRAAIDHLCGKYGAYTGIRELSGIFQWRE